VCLERLASITTTAAIIMLDNADWSC